MRCEQMYHFQEDVFTACPCFDTLFSLFQSNHSLSLSLALSFILSLFLSHSQTHVTYVSFYTSTSFFSSYLAISIWASMPISSKWQLGPQVYMIKFPEKRNWLSKLETGFHSWNIQLWPGHRVTWEVGCLLYAISKADSLREGDRHSPNQR